mgnify:CR=1 FL=1
MKYILADELSGSTFEICSSICLTSSWVATSFSLSSIIALTIWVNCELEHVSFKSFNSSANADCAVRNTVCCALTATWFVENVSSRSAADLAWSPRIFSALSFCSLVVTVSASRFAKLALICDIKNWAYFMERYK